MVDENKLTISGENVGKLAKILEDGASFGIRRGRKKDSLTFEFI